MYLSKTQSPYASSLKTPNWYPILYSLISFLLTISYILNFCNKLFISTILKAIEFPIEWSEHDLPNHFPIVEILVSNIIAITYNALMRMFVTKSFLHFGL